MDIITYALLRKRIKELEQKIDNLGKYLGITTTELQDGDNTNPIIIDNEYVTAKSGDWVIRYDTNEEFMFNGSVWQKIGESSDTDYKTLLNKPSINGVVLEDNKTFEELGREDIKNARIKQIIDEQYDRIFGGGN